MIGMLLTEDQQKHLLHILTTYRGDGPVLQAALGALLLGRVYGWRVLRVAYSSATYAKYQRLLQVDFKQWCEPTTEFTHRHRGYEMIGKLDNFWKIIKSEVPQPEGLAEVKKVFG
jgi:hypothetical protein